MAGVKGRKRGPSRKDDRHKVWQSMRILKKFSLPDLIRTSAAVRDNVRKFVLSLVIHGYLGECPGWQRGQAGSLKYWVLKINPGPDRPAVCVHCGQPLTAKQCGPGPDEEAA